VHDFASARSHASLKPVALLLGGVHPDALSQLPQRALAAVESEDVIGLRAKGFAITMVPPTTARFAEHPSLRLDQRPPTIESDDYVRFVTSADCHELLSPTTLRAR
jgi:hypothetical protein